MGNPPTPSFSLSMPITSKYYKITKKNKDQKHLVCI